MKKRLKTIIYAAAVTAALAALPGVASAAELYADGQPLPDGTSIYGDISGGNLTLQVPSGPSMTCAGSRIGLGITHQSAIPGDVIRGTLLNWYGVGTGAGSGCPISNPLWGGPAIVTFDTDGYNGGASACFSGTTNWSFATCSSGTSLRMTLNFTDGSGTCRYQSSQFGTPSPLQASVDTGSPATLRVGFTQFSKTGGTSSAPFCNGTLYLNNSGGSLPPVGNWQLRNLADAAPVTLVTP